MKVGVVSSAELAESGRWDARFHLLAAEHRAVAHELFDRFDLAELVALATDLPFDKAAADAVFPSVEGLGTARFRDVVAGLAEKPPDQEIAPGLGRYRRPQVSARRRKKDLAVYCAAASHSARDRVLGEVLELARQKLAKLEALKRLLDLADAKSAPALRAALSGRSYPFK